MNTLTQDSKISRQKYSRKTSSIPLPVHGFVNAILRVISRHAGRENRSDTASKELRGKESIHQVVSLEKEVKRAIPHQALSQQLTGPRTRGRMQTGPGDSGQTVELPPCRRPVSEAEAEARVGSRLGSTRNPPPPRPRKAPLLGGGVLAVDTAV